MIEALKLHLKNEIESALLRVYGTKAEIVLENPKRMDQGDISVVIFTAVKQLKKPLPEVVAFVKSAIEQSPEAKLLTRIDVIGGFINLYLNKQKMAESLLTEFASNGSELSPITVGAGQTVCIDYSSPNIAKPFSVGHLRSTIIGAAIGNILEKCGYRVVRINHLGDFGTQFGKIIYSYLHFGDPEKVRKHPIEELVKLYVEFHELAEKDPRLEDEARRIFKELEENKEEYVRLWQYFREESLKDYMKVYDLLNVSFDSYNGEAFYNDKMQPVIQELKEKGLLKEDQGAMIVDLGDDIPPALIQKSDGSTLYITRDLAALFYRKNTYHFDKVLYVVGNEQKLHFEQIKRVVTKMGYPYANQIEHVNFGLVLQDGKKMSTRKGKIVKLEDVLKEAIDLSKQVIEEKNPNLEDRKDIAQKVGVSAVIFNDLKNYRGNDFEFNLGEMVNFNGQTGPYLQYTSVRITSILNSAEIVEEAGFDYSLFDDAETFEIIKALSLYEDTILRSKDEYAPSVLAKYLLNLASLFNTFYSKEKILTDDVKLRNTKLRLIAYVRRILDDGMKLLGMQIIQRM